MSGLIHEEILVETIEEPVVESETVRTLRQARELIKQGWTRGAFWRQIKPSRLNESVDRYCALGAIGQARSGNPFSGPRTFGVVNRLEKGIRTVDPNYRCSQGVASWNDQQNSKSTVLAAFDKAIELAKTE